MLNRPMKRQICCAVLIVILGLAASASAGAQTKAQDFFDRADAKCRQGDFDGAIANYTRAIRYNPKFAMEIGRAHV